MRLKRNQLEEAISFVHGASAASPDSELKTRIKRLLETDRRKGRSPRSSDPDRAQYAFYGGEAPGSGTEVWFSLYEAFAVSTALRLLEHGLPQAAVVSVMRRARPVLEPKHTEILMRDPSKTFDEEEIFRSRQAGSLAVAAVNPMFLAIVSRRPRHGGHGPREAPEVKVLEEDELSRLWRSEAGLSVTIFELVRAAHELRRALMMTSPSKRGPIGR